MHHHRRKARANRRERGASLIEYALLLALIAVVALSAVSFLGGSVSGRFHPVELLHHCGRERPGSTAGC
ncbi:MAG: Flp family type IVb pilin [Acidimicrobiales bacterium]